MNQRYFRTRSVSCPLLSLVCKLLYIKRMCVWSINVSPGKWCLLLVPIKDASVLSFNSRPWSCLRASWAWVWSVYYKIEQKTCWFVINKTCFWRWSFHQPGGTLGFSLRSLLPSLSSFSIPGLPLISLSTHIASSWIPFCSTIRNWLLQMQW